MTTLYPFRFEPVLRRYMWGGKKLGAVLGRPVGAGQSCAESWEVVDHGDDQSRVAAGPLAGVTLGDLVKQHGPALLGRHHPQSRFPLLYKFLDAQGALSLQVHPNDSQAARLDPPDLGKMEAWLILEAEPGSVVYAGLKRGFDRHALEREIHRGACELCLHKIEPRAGDCIFLPPGVVHSAGAGLLIAEIQQSSDTTWRLFDWNRLGPDGQLRPLHIEQALPVIDYNYGPVSPQRPQSTERPHVRRLVECEKFIFDRWEFDQPESIGGDDRFHIVSVLAGQVVVPGDCLGQPLNKGETILLPACTARCELIPRGPAVLLDMYLP